MTSPDENETQNPLLKIMVVGNGAVGKTSMLMLYRDGKCPMDYIPYNTDFESQFVIDGQSVKAAFYEPTGGEDFERLRPICYPNTDVFLLCFDVGNRISFECLDEVWVPELCHHCPEVPVVLIGCKEDLRTTAPDRCVPEAEIKTKAEEWAILHYFETSAHGNVGIHTALKHGMRIGLHHHRYVASIKTSGRSKGHSAKQPPPIPIQEPLPSIEIDSSTFAHDWLTAIKDQRYTDVIFLLGSGTEMKAHKIVLCAASSFFASLINANLQSKESRSTNYPGISGIYLTKNDLNFVLEGEIKDQSLSACLQFIYSGLPGITVDATPQEMENVRYLCSIWGLDLLETICNNIKDADEQLNPSIGDFHNRQMGEHLKQDFLVGQQWADISFDIEGRIVPAHRVVVCSRSPVFASMLSDNFKEGSQPQACIKIPNATYHSFFTLLEYLYSDHAPIEQGDPVEVLVLANQYCIPRLVTLAEYCIAKTIEETLSRKTSLEGDMNIFNVMYNSKDHNAKQLPNWCLHFIARNYEIFKSQLQSPQLTDRDLVFVEEHRWPPISYLQELAEYKARRKKCIVL